MVEGTDHNELEKLRVYKEEDDVKKPAAPAPTQDPQRWRMMLEPALIGSMIAINLGQTSLQNFYLRTACTVDLGLEESVCNSGVGEQFRSAEERSQYVVANVNITRSFIGSMISTLVLLFVGPWSDCSGRRKPLLIMPLVGMSVMTTAVLLLLTFPGASTVNVLYAVQIPISLGGNFGLLLAAAFSHIGDVCHATGRDVTRTMGTHRAAIQVAHVVGCICGPLLYRYTGFYVVFSTVLFLQLSSLIFVIVVVKDVNINRENEVSVFNWRLPFNAIQCLMRKRQGQKRKIIFFMLVVALADRMILSAEVLIAYMYYRRKFNWDDVLFGSFLAYRNIVSFFGTLIILSVLKRTMKLSDECVGVVSCISFVMGTSGLIAAKSSITVFVLCIIGIISQGSQVVQRPILNKQILPTEQGKIYSVMGALESATQTFSSPLYSLLYSKTVSHNPDSWLVPGIILAVIQMSSYWISRELSKRTVYDEQPAVAKNVQMNNIEHSKIVKPNSSPKNNDENEVEEKVALKLNDNKV